MAYVPPPASNGAARPVVPCVRLGAMMEAALKEKGTTVDESFKSTLEGRLEDVILSFVFLKGDLKVVLQLEYRNIYMGSCYNILYIQ